MIPASILVAADGLAVPGKLPVYAHSENSKALPRGKESFRLDVSLYYVIRAITISDGWSRGDSRIFRGTGEVLEILGASIVPALMRNHWVGSGSGCCFRQRHAAQPELVAGGVK